ncbi:MAG: iron-containing alcohol dehydrogenase [Christensenellaceae bacterium]|jgi:alcohol dehydrogenase YqhD (iron-dependent ADH family)|nr:iron-containing alcohol dehydrogenase [Christensenellaceae bacterium]
MLNFEYQNACEIVFGERSEAEIAVRIKKLGSKKVLVLFGGSSARKSGLIDRIFVSLKALSISYVSLGGVRANPSKALLLEGVALAKAEKVDFVLAVGGGSTIDTAKGIAVGAKTADVWKFYTKGKAITKALPVGAVLTIPAAGSECSTASVIRDENSGLKYCVGSELIRPKFAFINPALCATLPNEQVANGISDILAHLLERYFSPQTNVTVTDKLITGAIQAVFAIGKSVRDNPSDYDLMSELCLAGTIAHNDMLDMGRPEQDWGSHQIENALLSGVCDIAHGEGLAIIFPAWLKLVAVKKPGKILQFAEEVMLVTDGAHCEKIAAAIAKLEYFYKSIGLETTLSGMNIPLEKVKNAAAAINNSKSAVGGYGLLNKKEILKLLELAE